MVFKNIDFADTTIALKALERQTSKSTFVISSYFYDATNCKVQFNIRRYPFHLTSNKLLGLFGSGTYADEIVESKVVIGNVLSADLKSRFGKGRFGKDKIEFQIVLGIAFKDDAFIICSADEEKGEPFFLLEIHVKAIEFELVDLV